MSKQVLKGKNCAAGVALLCVLAFASDAAARQKADDRPAAKTGGAASPVASPQASAGAERQGKPADRAALAGEVTQKRAELSESEKLLLAPPPEDMEAYADFLKLKNTGLVRLLPRETFQGRLAISGGGAYYSFARLTHEYNFGSDIELYNDYFTTGFAGASFGFLVDLGDVPLETLSRETFGVRQIAEYKPPVALPKAREEQRRAGEGFQVEGFTYKRRLPVRVDNTYAVRSVDYDRSDLLVAFRVVRKDSDGSVVLLWRLLKKYSKPQLDRNTMSSER